MPSSSNSAINNQQQQQQQATIGYVDQNRWTPNNTKVAADKVQSQKQQSGETLSSFESDYDLLVYLGETETEDIVDTERSLDYQDQTWRQSICGGASLAPTIDESLSELIGIGSSNNFSNNQAHNSYQDFDLLNTPTISPFKAHSPSPPRSASTSFQQQQQPQQRQLFNDENSPKLPANYSQRQVKPVNVRPVKQLKAVESGDECDHEVSLVFKQQQQQASTSGAKSPWKSQQEAHNSQAQAKRLDLLQAKGEEEGRVLKGEENQQQQKLVGNIGNKLVSLFNRRQVPRGNNLRQAPETEHEFERFRNENFVEPKSSLDSELYRAKSRTSGARQEPSNTDRGLSINDLDTLQGVHYNNKFQLQDRYRDSGLNPIKSTSLSDAKSVVADSKGNMIGRRQNNNNESSSSAMSAHDAAELDRLLAEMSQSLDLNSLARYQPTSGYSSAQQVASSNFGHPTRQQQQQPADTSQTLSKFHHQTSSSSPKSTQFRLQQQQQGKYAAQAHHQLFCNNDEIKSVAKSNLLDNNDRLKQQTLPNKWRNADSNQQEFYQNSNTQASCESILDEFDGASRMLEQMISDQLDGSKALHGQKTAFKPASRNSEQKVDEIRSVDSPVTRESDIIQQQQQQQAATITTSLASTNKQRTTANSSSPSANSATSRRESKSSVIYREEPITQAVTTTTTTTATAGSDQEHTSSLQERSRKVSTCSSSMTNTDATSVVLATKVGELSANKRDIFENRSVWRHRRSTKSSGHTGTPPSGEENINSSCVFKPSKKSAIAPQLSLDLKEALKESERIDIQRALASHSLGSTPANVSPALKLKNCNPKTVAETSNLIDGNSLADQVNSRAPTPPAVDYGDSDGAEVIRVEAAAITSSLSSSSSEDEAGEISVLRGESQMDKMKRRTLTSMRSMRSRFSDFMGNNAEKQSSHENPKQKQKQKSKLKSIQRHEEQQFVAANNKGSQKEQPTALSAPPKPPKRSSSIGSQEGSQSRGKQSSQAVSSGNPHHEQASSMQPHQALDERFIINNPTQTNKKSERLSRSKRRQGRISPPPVENTNANQSFGQQIRERLSRSKSRLSRFLRPAAKRAQSTPNTRQDLKEMEKLEHDDNKLFQPSDIARNCDLQRIQTDETSRGENKRPQRSEDSFNESLDRHLAASLAANKETTTAATKSSKSQESDSSSLSGLDMAHFRSRSRSKKKKSSTMLPNMMKDESRESHHQHQQQARSKSLLSIKRLSSFRNKEDNLNRDETNKQVEDFDSIKVSTTNELPGKKRRRNRKRSEKNRSSDEQSSQTSPIVQTRVSITNDYFGQIGPAKADSHDDEIMKLSSSSLSDPLRDNKRLEGIIKSSSNITPVDGDKQENRLHHDPKLRLDLQQDPLSSQSADGSSTSASKPAILSNKNTVECHPKRPNRSQSMKCIGRKVNGCESPVMDGNGAINKSETTREVSKESRTSSFSNLNRRLPSSTNTFRPISACAKLDDTRLQNNSPSLSSQPTNKSKDQEREQELKVTCNHLEVVTPIGPSNSPLSGYRLDSAKPPQLDQQHTYRASNSQSRPTGSVSPIRAKSAAVLDDIRNKCSEFFTSPQARRRAAAVSGKSNEQTESPDLRPVRPPRKINKSVERRRRSKSVHAGPAIGHASDSDDGVKGAIIIAKAASPSSTLDGRDDILSPRTTPIPSKGNKLSAFAQHIRQTFQGSGSRRGHGAPQTRARSPVVVVEPAVASTLVEWKPVIARSYDQKRSAGVVNKQLISQLGQTSKGKLMKLMK